MNRQVKQLSPSLMCGDWLNLAAVIHQLESAQVEWLHIDVMDGHFVPNITFGIESVRRIKAATHIPLDVHLMTYHPEQYFDVLPLDSRDLISFHYEAVHDVMSVLSMLLAKNVRAGIALKPETSCEVVTPYLEHIYAVLLMMTRPGSYGRPIEPGMIDKIVRTQALIHGHRARTLVEVDGSVSFALAGDMSRAGANLFVAGSSSVFSMETTIADGTSRLRCAVSEGNGIRRGSERSGGVLLP